MESILTMEGLLALLTLTFLEIVLGVDNIIFISIVSNKLPEHQRAKARNIGLTLALVFRLMMLFGIKWILSFTEPIMSVPNPFGELPLDLSARDLILLVGGLFLIAKSTSEIGHHMQGGHQEKKGGKAASMSRIIAQIVALDIIFSLDSILTAVGMTDQIAIMVTAVIISLIIMMAFSGNISAFINKHPSLQILALSFLILIGFMLTVEAIHYHVPKGYIYFALFFSFMVELINLRIRKKSQPLTLHKRITEEDT